MEKQEKEKEEKEKQEREKLEKERLESDLESDLEIILDDELCCK